MFSFFFKKLSSNDFTIFLRDIEEDKQRFQFDVSRYLGRREEKYGNTLLTHAIATGRYLAAIKLILYVLCEQDASLLNEADQFPSSQSTPLILAAKVAHNALAFTLLASRFVAQFINKTDYRGNTALHYAAITRNNALIKKLLTYGAKIDVYNNAGLTPAFLYAEQIKFDDLIYPYKILDEHKYVLNHVCDWDKGYSGTKNANYSFLRWFLPAVLLNMGMVDITKEPGTAAFYICTFGINGFEPKLNQFKNKDIRSLVEYHFETGKPIVDNRIYQLVREMFINVRDESYDDDISGQLGNLAEHEFTLIKEAGSIFCL